MPSAINTLVLLKHLKNHFKCEIPYMDVLVDCGRCSELHLKSLSRPLYSPKPTYSLICHCYVRRGREARPLSALLFYLEVVCGENIRTFKSVLMINLSSNPDFGSH